MGHGSNGSGLKWLALPCFESAAQEKRVPTHRGGSQSIKYLRRSRRRVAHPNQIRGHMCVFGFETRVGYLRNALFELENAISNSCPLQEMEGLI